MIVELLTFLYNYFKVSTLTHTKFSSVLKSLEISFSPVWESCYKNIRDDDHSTPGYSPYKNTQRNTFIRTLGDQNHNYIFILSF